MRSLSDRTSCAASAGSSGIRPVYKAVDTCAGEFAASTPYLYSSYDEESEVPTRTKEAVHHPRLRPEPHRPGHRVRLLLRVTPSFALSEAGYETIMVNCNPETVSTDYDTSDRLYFEPLTPEDVLEIYHAELKAGPVAGVICQLGGQTPLKLAQTLKDAGVPIVGTSPEAINLAEERGRVRPAWLPAPASPPRSSGMATTADEAIKAIAREIGYPVVIRPSYVLGGRGMQDRLQRRVPRDLHLAKATEDERTDQPVLVDRFLDDAIEIDVDALYDGTDLYIGGIMEHIEEAGIHSGDSACSLPPVDAAATPSSSIDPALHPGDRAGTAWACEGC